MADLVAQGPEQTQQWRRTLRPVTVRLGRSPGVSEWAVPWDPKISRLHATLTWHNGQLHVHRLPNSRNRIFHQGESKEDFYARPGEAFTIGDTTFSVVDQPIAEPPIPASEVTCSGEHLRSVAYVDAAERIEVLSSLPEVIRLAMTEEEMEMRVVEVLLRGIPRAVAAAIVRLPPDCPEGMPVEIRTMEHLPGLPPTFQPSRRLVHDALYQRGQSVMHIWDKGELRSITYTQVAGLDWALCTPIPDQSAPGWALYITGHLIGVGLPKPGGRNNERTAILTSDLKFAQVVADIFSALRQVTSLQRREGVLSRFFSRPVRAALATQDIDQVLQPRETTVTVLFCDLRGSCRMHDASALDLFPLWQRVSAALGIMSSSILDEDGVCNDFQGDAAMGFWGWPLPQEDQIERATRAALMIRRRFAEVARDPRHPLAGFSYGIGIAHGSALAGRLGTSDQFKVDVFGPTVNLAARLEGMTKHFGVPILLDDACSAYLQKVEGPAWGHVRRLARVQPYGMTRVLTVSELLPLESEPGMCTPEQALRYEQALDLFQGGRWQDAQQILASLPDEGGKKFLLSCMQGKPKPPPGWNGVVALAVK